MQVARHCERSEAIQTLARRQLWIASSLALLAMTTRLSFTRLIDVDASAIVEA
jgi:hypothetical protein